MHKTVDDYIASLGGAGKEWVTLFVSFMRNNYPHVSEGLSYQIPTYKKGNTYLAFAAAPSHFIFQTWEREVLEQMRDLLPGAEFTKDKVKVLYKDVRSQKVLLEGCRSILEDA